MASADVQDQLGQVLIDFSTIGAFPEEESISAAYVQKPSLAPALAALGAARAELEVSVPPQFGLSPNNEANLAT
jgi:centromere/kinetochore protein ZW10